MLGTSKLPQNKQELLTSIRSANIEYVSVVEPINKTSIKTALAEVSKMAPRLNKMSVVIIRHR